MHKIKEMIILFSVFLMIIQSVSAISNVQHSVDGNKITLSYQGTPPFLINIRPDTNIGQSGGYLWAKTYSNSFTYDLGFAINPSKKFYYGVKDFEWSTVNNFNTQNQLSCGSNHGIICRNNEFCDGDILYAEDTDNCCDGLCIIPETWLSCSDTDNFLDYSNAGTVTATFSYKGQEKTVSLNDICLGGQLLEWFCDGRMPVKKFFNCPKMCSNGRCDGSQFQCSELIPGYNNPSANKINLIFIGYGYENFSKLQKGIIYNVSYGIITHPEMGLFSLNPYKGYNNKFNLWYINQSGLLTEYCVFNSNWHCDDSLLIEGCPINNRYRVHLVNSNQGWSSGGNPINLQSAEEMCNSRCRAGTFVHEFSHSFGLLLDEYYGDPNALANYLINDSDKNCYAGPAHTQEECLLKAQWKDLIGDGCGEDGIIDCPEGNPNYDKEIGCFEGCNYVGLDIFRPTRGSFMVDGNRYPYFGLWNEKILRDKLSKFDG
jgi:hypothetical protein